MIGLNSSNFYYMLTFGLIRLYLYHTSPQCSTRGEYSACWLHHYDSKCSIINHSFGHFLSILRANKEFCLVISTPCSTDALVKWGTSLVQCPTARILHLSRLVLYLLTDNVKVRSLSNVI